MEKIRKRNIGKVCIGGTRMRDGVNGLVVVRGCRAAEKNAKKWKEKELFIEYGV